MDTVTNRRQYISKPHKWFIGVATVAFFGLLIWGSTQAYRFMQKTGITPGLFIRLLVRDGITLKSS
jgi:hypothetical protein